MVDRGDVLFNRIGRLRHSDESQRPSYRLFLILSQSVRNNGVGIAMTDAMRFLQHRNEFHVLCRVVVAHQRLLVSYLATVFF